MILSDKCRCYFLQIVSETGMQNLIEMKVFYLVASFMFFSVAGFGQVAKGLAKKPDASKKVMTVEASCGECNFGLPGNNCDLAVKIDGKAYFVDGVDISHYGHPHDKNGFCMVVRQAEVQGEVKDGRFKASYFKLLNVEKAKKSGK